MLKAGQSREREAEFVFDVKAESLRVVKGVKNRRFGRRGR